MDIKIVDQQGIEQEPNKLDEHHQPGESVGVDNELNRIAIAQVLGIELSEMKKNESKIDQIIQWADGKYNNFTELKWIIRNLEAKLGSPNFGETRISKLSRYAYLDMEGKRLEQEKMSLYE